MSAKSLRLRLVARRDRLQHRLVAAVEEIRRPPPGVRVRPAHEAVADHADVEIFRGHLFLPLRTRIPLPLRGGAEEGAPTSRNPHPDPLPARGRGARGYSRQPCASRTLSIAPRTLFQVSCFSITAFGNMQPSQQMWRIFLVSSPLSSRSQ